MQKKAPRLIQKGKGTDTNSLDASEYTKSEGISNIHNVSKIRDKALHQEA